MSEVSNSRISDRITGLIVIAACGPFALGLSGLASIFLINEIVNGLIPTRWFSTNVADWLFGAGTQGSARNYFGFILSALAASPFWAGVNWGRAKIVPALAHDLHDDA